MLVVGKNKAGGPILQMGWLGSQAGWIDVPALTADIFAAATYGTNIHNKICSMCHY
jgi:hypothetical protein